MTLYYLSWREKDNSYRESKNLYTAYEAQEQAHVIAMKGFDYIRIRPYKPLIGEIDGHLSYIPYGW